MNCQKEMMASGKAYPRTCQNCSLGPCKLGYPGYYIPGRDGPLVADPNLLPRTRETNPSPDTSVTEPGEENAPKPRPQVTCTKCKKAAGVTVSVWEASDGGHEDYHYRCECGHSWWVDGVDS